MLILASCNDNKERLIVENYDMYEKKLLQTIECSLINNYQTTDVMLCDFQDGQLGYQVNQVIPVENDEFIYSSQYILLDVLSNEIQICLNEDYRVECFFRKNNNEIVEIYKENYGDKYSEYSAKIFNAGKEIFTKNLTSEILKSWYVDDIYHDAENVYFNLYNDNYEGCLLVYDFDFNLVNTYNNANQQIFCYENSVEGCLFELERHELYCYDSNNNKFNKYNNFDNSQFYSFNGDSLYDFYYAEIDSTNEVEDTFLIGYKKGKYYKILSFNEMGVSDFDDFLTDNEGGFFAIDYGTNGAESIYHIENSDEVYSLKDNKIIIKVAGLYSYMNQYVEKYNEQSDKYYVEFIEYGNDLEYDEALKALYLDAQTGVEIDIISLFGLNKNDFIKNGVLEDLNISYLSRGGNISKNDFTDYSIDIMTENNGEIYSLFNEYTVGGIWGKSDFNTSLIDNYLNP